MQERELLGDGRAAKRQLAAGRGLLSFQGTFPGPPSPSSVRHAALFLILGLACGRGETGTVVEFWAIGREGEHVARWCRPSSAASGRDGARAADPVERGAREAADRVRGRRAARRDPARQYWIPEFVALGALEPLEPGSRRRRRSTRATSSRACSTPRCWRARRCALPGTPTRACSSTGRLLAAAGRAEPPQLAGVARRRRRACRRGGGPGTRAAAAARRVGGARRSSRSSTAPSCCATAIATGTSQPRLPRGLRLLSRACSSEASRRGRAWRSSRTCTRISPRARSAARHRALEPGRVRARLPAEFADALGDGADARLAGEGPGVSLAGGASLALVATSAHKEAVWAWIAFLAEPEQQAEFHRLSGDLPARRSAWDDRRWRVTRVAAFPRSSRTCARRRSCPEWERIASRIAWHAETAVREGRRPTPCSRRSTRTPTRCSRSAAALLARASPRSSHSVSFSAPLRPSLGRSRKMKLYGVNGSPFVRKVLRRARGEDSPLRDSADDFGPRRPRARSCSPSTPWARSPSCGTGTSWSPTRR